MATASQHAHSIQFHGLGLLTTVASLPPKYRSRYLNLKTKCEIPLDLSVKPPSPSPAPVSVSAPIYPTSPSPQLANDVPIATTFTEVYTEERPSESGSNTISEQERPMIVSEKVSEEMVVHHEVIILTERPPPPPYTSPAKRKFVEINEEPQLQDLPTTSTAAATSAAATTTVVACETNISYENPTKMAKTRTHPTVKRDATPTKPIRGNDTAPRKSKVATPSTKPARTKATRKLKFDEETSSPVSGTVIRPLEDITDGDVQYSNGDIDPKYNIVEITEETKAELAAIKNVIGDYVCKLCRIKFDDAFGLAQHRCACIVLLEYRCPECGKQFNCPANLASHRRWHKPKKEASGGNGATGATKKENRSPTNQQVAQVNKVKSNPADVCIFACSECGKKFKRQAYLRKHQQTHNKTVVSGQEASSTVETATSTSIRSTVSATTSTTTTIVGSFQSAPYVNSISGSVASTSSAASSASTHEDEGVYVDRVRSYNDFEADSMSDCSSTSSSTGYGRLQIIEHGFTEEESIAAAALTNLRNCASVIQHTTMAH